MPLGRYFHSCTSWAMHGGLTERAHAMQSSTRHYKVIKVNLFDRCIRVVIASLCGAMNCFHEAHIAGIMINKITINHRVSTEQMPSCFEWL